MLNEGELARYLLDTPAFFERHAEVLAAVRLTSPHGPRAVSLQERQMEMLRDKIKGLEHKIIEMIRHSQDNEAIADRLHRFTQAILLTTDPGELPEVIGMSDRIIVMRDGRQAGELSAGATEEQVLALATGVAEAKGGAA